MLRECARYEALVKILLYCDLKFDNFFNNVEVPTFDISPDCNRALFGARGDVFTVPAKYGNTRNITGTPGVHERNAAWSPDGKYVAYVSDASGEDEIWMEKQDGAAAPVQLTKGGDTYKFSIVWSPSGARGVPINTSCSSSE